MALFFQNRPKGFPPCIVGKVKTTNQPKARPRLCSPGNPLCDLGWELFQPCIGTQVLHCNQFKVEDKRKTHPCPEVQHRGPFCSTPNACWMLPNYFSHCFVLVCFKTREWISAHSNHNSCNVFNRVMSIYSSRKSYPKSFLTVRSLLLLNRIFHITLC